MFFPVATFSFATLQCLLCLVEVCFVVAIKIGEVADCLAPRCVLKGHRHKAESSYEHAVQSSGSYEGMWDRQLPWVLLINNKKGINTAQKKQANGQQYPYPLV